MVSKHQGGCFNKFRDVWVMGTVVYKELLRILDMGFQTNGYLYLMKKSGLVTKHISVNLSHLWIIDEFEYFRARQ